LFCSVNTAVNNQGNSVDKENLRVHNPYSTR